MPLLRDSLIWSVRGVEREEAPGGQRRMCARTKEAARSKERQTQSEEERRGGESRAMAPISRWRCWDIVCHADITESFCYLGRQFSLSLAEDSSSVPLPAHCQRRIKGAQKWTSHSAFPVSCPLFLETQPWLVTHPAHMALPVIG